MCRLVVVPSERASLSRQKRKGAVKEYLEELEQDTDRKAERWYVSLCCIAMQAAAPKLDADSWPRPCMHALKHSMRLQVHAARMLLLISQDISSAACAMLIACMACTLSPSH